MFSLPKLLVLGLIVAVVWFGFKALERGGRVPRAEDKSDTRKLGAKDLVKCRVCGVYVAADGPPGCGRSDCPHGAGDATDG
ncbi:MAG: hypothetical protein ACTS3R_07640 [Inquilinaceae bacterium]